MKLKQLIYCLVVACPILVYGQAKIRSDKFLKRVVFNQIDHVYLGGHVGINIMFYHSNRVEDGLVVSSSLQGDPNPIIEPSIPTFRVYGGYQFKRHAFETGVENLEMPKYGGPKLTYKTCFFTSVSYNIDLLYKKPHFKLFGGGQFGVIAIMDHIMPQPDNTVVLPGAGVNFKMEIPSTKTTSVYFETRFIWGLAPTVKGLSYENVPDGYYQRIFAMNLTFGIKFKMFSKKNYSIGMQNFEKLKLEAVGRQSN